MKKYIDIEVLKEEVVELDNGITIDRNDYAFEKGDIISITEKIDGSNTSIEYNKDTGKLRCFSRNFELPKDKALQGFYDYVQNDLNADDFADTPDYIVFGEWLIKNKIIYNSDAMNKWYVYSIFDRSIEQWLSQEVVKEFCKKHNLLYVHEFYYGPFISWEHCKSFMNSPNYGDIQEGIVVRNITKLSDPECHYNHILKLVNEAFRESIKHRKHRVNNSERDAEWTKADKLVDTIVTKNRVEKILLKLINEGELPSNLKMKDISLIAKKLPKAIYEDCCKEEPEIITALGDKAGKTVAGKTMYHLKAILINK